MAYTSLGIVLFARCIGTRRFEFSPHVCVMYRIIYLPENAILLVGLHVVLSCVVNVARFSGFISSSVVILLPFFGRVLLDISFIATSGKIVSRGVACSVYPGIYPRI